MGKPRWITGFPLDTLASFHSAFHRVSQMFGFDKSKNSAWHEGRTQKFERIHWPVSFLPIQVPGSSPFCVSCTWCTDRETAGTQNVSVHWVAELLGAVQIKHIFLSFAPFMVSTQWDTKRINLSRISNGSFVRMKTRRSQRMKKSWRPGFGWRGSAGAELPGTWCAGQEIKAWTPHGGGAVSRCRITRVWAGKAKEKMTLGI